LTFCIIAVNWREIAAEAAPALAAIAGFECIDANENEHPEAQG
jgi:hypothetical protein